MIVYQLALTNVFVTSLFALLLLTSGCASTHKNSDIEDPETQNEQQEIENALKSFKQQTELDVYFKQAKGIAILPQNIRAGTGFGGAVGYGWLVINDESIGRVLNLQFFIGADLGIQKYRQILFFKTKEAVKKFQKGTFEFAGQANATALLWGKGWTPTYNSDVAIFTLIDGGLLLEGSVGAHRYDFFSN